jgi:hypothetical protein
MGWMVNATLRPPYSRKNPVTILQEAWGGGPRAGLDGFGKSCLHRGSNRGLSSP